MADDGLAEIGLAPFARALTHNSFSLNATWSMSASLRQRSKRCIARIDVKCVFRDAQTLCGKLSHARFWRVFASLSGLCLGQSWLGQSPKRCARVAGWNVCTTRSKDVIRVAELGGDDLDDCLGVARIYFCALRNVETSPRPDCEPRSARPKIAADSDPPEQRMRRQCCSAVGWANRSCGLATWARRSHDLPTRTNPPSAFAQPTFHHCNGENSAGRKMSACWARS